jgi:hypothetical protein
VAKRHLTPGWCWRADLDGEPAVWGIRGHFSDAEAIDIVAAYEGGTVVRDMAVSRDYRRSVPCRREHCDCDGGTHLERAKGPGPGAGPYTWVEAA